MRNQYLKLLIGIMALVLTGICFSSCKKYLDVTAKDQVTDATLWSSTETGDLFLNNIYAGIPSQNTDDPLDNYSDNSINGQAGKYSGDVYANSSYTPSNGPDRWGLYGNIRACNIFIDKVNASKLPDDWKTLRLAEARYLRAYFYSLLWTYYGGVPIITDVLDRNSQGDSIFRARSTDAETFDFITSECKAIAGDLPLEAAAGRATRGAALTLEGWCELFNASALKNPDNDKARWALAAATNKAVMDLKVYSLFPDYGQMFMEENNNNVEVIFEREHLGGTALANTRTYVDGPRWVNGNLQSWGQVDPTQDIVDEYEMANGLPITDPASGYDPDHPYENREQRFYQSVVYDGSVWLDFTMVMKQGVGSRNETDLSNSSTSTKTGYYLRKGMDPRYAAVYNDQNSASFIIFRYAEVLLSYAEAQNEAVGPDGSVYDAVNQVRARSALPPLPTGLDQDDMRAAIRRERRIELAFEDKRWYDLIRWKLAEKNLNGSLHAIVIQNENGKWVYNTKPAAGGQRTFYANKNYLMPIPQYAMDKNEKLTQNPNY